MATIIDLKEHLEKGGKIRRPCWEKGAFMKLEDDFIKEGGLLGGLGGLLYSKKELLLDDWEVYDDSFKVTHTGLYKTRDGRKAFVSSIDPSTNFTYVLYGVIEGGRCSWTWTKKGEVLENEENPEDIVAEWED